MRKFYILFTILFTTFCFSDIYAQNQEEEDPITIAEKEVVRLTKALNLTETQVFYVDSIITNNFVGIKTAFDDLRNSGRSEYQIFKQTQELWEEKRLTALKKVLDEQQYIKYLRLIGKGKEYKKGKDGKYYLKSELKKKNK